MKNLKDTITTICGVIIAICGTLVLLASTGAWDLPATVIGVAKAIGVIAGSVSLYLTGKNPDGSTKTETQVQDANAGK